MPRYSPWATVVLGLLMSAPLSACGGSSGPEGTAGSAGMTPPLAKSHEAPTANPATPQGDLVWEAPPDWVSETPANSMRKAQYRLPAAPGDGEGGECAVFYFGAGQGGDAKSNVARWASQFTTPHGGKAEIAATEQKVGDRVVARVEAAGIYHPTPIDFGGEPPAPKPGHMLLGAVVPGSVGDVGGSNWFFRCTGPEKTIQAQRAAFDSLIASIR